MSGHFFEGRICLIPFTVALALSVKWYESPVAEKTHISCI